MKKYIALLCALCLLFSGCGKKDAENTDPTADTGTTVSADAITDFAQTDADMFTDRDKRTDYESGKAIKIQLSDTASAAGVNSVIIDGSTVTITEEGIYEINGTLSDGMLIVDAPETAKLQLVFYNAHITNSTGAALYIKQADKVFLTLASNYNNTLANGGSFTATDEANIDGALFSQQDLTINGAGDLTVTSPAGHGIVCKDDLVLTGGNLTVTAASHGLDANDSIRLTNTSLNITAGKDGLHAENNDDEAKGFVYISSGDLSISAEGDGISAGAFVQLEGGNVDILAGGGSENGTQANSGSYGDFMPGGRPGGGGYPGGGGRPGSGGYPGGSTGSTEPATNLSVTTTAEAATDSTSMKGIKAGTSLLVNDGTYTIDSADDALHANKNLTVNGGTFTLKTGDDGVHAEEYLVVTDCTMTISESYEGLEALHIQVDGGDITLTASDDGLNAAGGVDNSGAGGRDGQFGGRPGGYPGGGNSNGSVVINDGKLQITASGDGIDANGTLAIAGGHVTVTGPTRGDTATLDYDVSAAVTGGTFIGTGAAGMAQSFSECTQGLISVRAGSYSAGTTITVADESGNVLVSHTPSLDFQVIIITCPQMVKGETYTMTVGDLTDSITAG